MNLGGAPPPVVIAGRPIASFTDAELVDVLRDVQRYGSLPPRVVAGVGTSGNLQNFVRLLKTPGFAHEAQEIIGRYAYIRAAVQAQQAAAVAAQRGAGAPAHAGVAIPGVPAANANMSAYQQQILAMREQQMRQNQQAARQRKQDAVRMPGGPQGVDVIQEGEQHTDDEEELDHADIYSQYKPAKVSEGKDHPAPIVESQSLAGVIPPDPEYKHHLKEDVKAGRLSNAQLETVMYACMRFKQELPNGERAGFFLGDGAGVGKGRQIAALCKEFWQAGGRRILWVSTSKDLAYDARRDLKDMNMEKEIDVWPKGKDSLPQGDLAKQYTKGVVFITYTLLTVKGRNGKAVREAQAAMEAAEEEEARQAEMGEVAAYGGRIHTNARKTAKKAAQQDRARKLKEASLTANDSRLMQIVNWLKDKDPEDKHGQNALIILDECHRAKNLLDSSGNSTLTGLAVEKLQILLPKARVLYSSATGASEPQNLLYMRRVGTYGFHDMHDMVKSLQKSGLGGVELFSMGLKASGTYLSRTLSYKDAEFRLEQIKIDPAFRVMYNRSTMLWTLLHNVLKQLPKKGRGRDARQGLFWSAHQRFYKCMLMASKVRRCSELAVQALKDGMCIVIGLQSTGEANMSAARELDGDEQDDLVSAPRMVLQQFVAKHMFKGIGTHTLNTNDMNKLLTQVYDVYKDWKRLKPCEEEAVRQLKSDDKAKKKKDKFLAEKQRKAELEAQRAARPALPIPFLAPRNKSPAKPAAAAAGSDDEIEIAGEMNLDQILERRKEEARLAGNFIDLTVQPADDDRVADVLQQLAKDEQDAAMKQEQDKFKEQEAAAVARLEEALKAVHDLKAKLGIASAGNAPSAANQAHEDAAPVDLNDLEDDDDDDEEEEDKNDKAKKGGRKGKSGSTGNASLGGRKRSRAVVDDEDVEVVDLDDSDDGKPVALSRQRTSEMGTSKATKTASVRGSVSVSTKAGSNKGSRPGSSAALYEDVTSPAAAVHAGGRSRRAAAMKADAATRKQLVIDSDPSSEDEDEDESDDDEASGSGSDENDDDKDSKKMDVKKKTQPSKKASTKKATPAAAAKSGKPPAGPGKGKKVAAKKKVVASESEDGDKDMEDDEIQSGSGSDGHDDSEGSDDHMDEDDDGIASDSERKANAKSGKPGRRLVSNVKKAGKSPAQKGTISSFFKSNGSTAAAANGALGATGLVQKLRLKKLEEAAEKASHDLDDLRYRWNKRKAELERGASAVGVGNKTGNAGSMDLDEDLPAYKMATAKNPLNKKKGGKGGDDKDKGKKDKDGKKKKAKGKGGSGGSDDDGDSDFKASGSDEEEAEEDNPLLQNEAEDDDDGPLPPVLQKVRAIILRLVDAIELPPNPLDQLTELLGGESKVAEMTGRKGMMVRGKDGKVTYKQRREEDAQKMVNLGEKEDFMTGKKLIAIISDAASTGISLQADARAQNQRRRFHITLELPWSADKAIQQFGRSHRSGQTSAPVYCLLVTKCGGEYRFAGAMAKRLSSLGALLQGDQRALGAAGNLKAYDIETQWARKALNKMYDCIAEGDEAPANVTIPVLPDDYYSPEDLAAANGLAEDIPVHNRYHAYRAAMRAALCNVGLGTIKYNHIMGEESLDLDVKVKTDVPRFLNRLLGVPLEGQDLLFGFFSGLLAAIIKQAKTEGKYQEGVEVIKGAEVRIDAQKTIHKDNKTGATSYYVKLRIDDGVSWEEACKRLEAHKVLLKESGVSDRDLSKTGFYIARNEMPAFKKQHILLATQVLKLHTDGITSYQITRPYQNKGMLIKSSDLTDKYRLCSEAELHGRAPDLWDWWYTTLLTNCLHGPNCKNKAATGECTMGSRVYYKHIITGALLPVLKTLFKVVEESPYGRTHDGRKDLPHALRCRVVGGGLGLFSDGPRALPAPSPAPKPGKPRDAGNAEVEVMELDDDSSGGDKKGNNKGKSNNNKSNANKSSNNKVVDKSEAGPSSKAAADVKKETKTTTRATAGKRVVEVMTISDSDDDDQITMSVATTRGKDAGNSTKDKDKDSKKASPDENKPPHGSAGVATAAHHSVASGSASVAAAVLSPSSRKNAALAAAVVSPARPGAARKGLVATTASQEHHEHVGPSSPSQQQQAGAAKDAGHLLVGFNLLRPDVELFLTALEIDF